MDDLVGKKHVNATRDRFDQAEAPVSLVLAVQAVCMAIPAGDMEAAGIVAKLIQDYVLGDLTMDKVRERGNDEPLKVFKKAVENCKPNVEVKSRRVGGAN